MAFEVSKTGYQQMSPTFLTGYAYENKYHNIGQLQTPYQGKMFGQGGDYGPPQKTRYYTVYNPTYPYVLDKDFRAEEYLPTEGCCFGRPGYFPCQEAQYPTRFTPPDYFSPKVNFPRGHALPEHMFGAQLNSGTVMAYAPQDHPINADTLIDLSDPGLRSSLKNSVRENYGGYDSAKGVFDRRNLRFAEKPLVGSKNFYPFLHGKHYTQE